MTTTLIYVRHGQSEANLSAVFTGQSDVPLTPLGQRQAALTADYLRAFPVRRVYASDLHRAMQTAEPTAVRHGLAVIPTAELREVNAGSWEGMPFEEIDRRYPVEFGTWLQDIASARCPGGETVAEVARRVTDCVNRIVADNRGSCVALFSHATPLRVLWCHWQGLPLLEASHVPWCSNASVTVVEYDDALRPNIVRYGYDAHLGDLVTRLPQKV